MEEAMKLQDFVKEALVQILAGVKAAQGSDEGGGCVSPQFSGGGDGSIGVTAEVNGRRVFPVRFEVGVVATRETEATGEGGFKLRVLSAGGQLSKATSAESTQRISFEVPIAYPLDGQTARAQDEHRKRGDRTLRGPLPQGMGY